MHTPLGTFLFSNLITLPLLNYTFSCMMKMVAFVCACCFDGLAYGIHCYQCASATNIDCGNELIHDTLDSSLEPTSCSFLFEARYCVKATGLHSGNILAVSYSCRLLVYIFFAFIQTYLDVNAV